MDQLPPDQVIPEHESALRRMVADGHGMPYQAFRSLGEAQLAADSAVVLEGDWGGTIYATCPARLIRCDEGRLGQLLRDLDAVIWPGQPEGASVYYERLPAGSHVSGGMGGGTVIDGVCVHDQFEVLGIAQEIRNVITGRADRITTRYQDVHIVVRVDKELERQRVEQNLSEEDRPYYSQFDVLKIVWSWKEAEIEVARLAQRDTDPTHTYFHAWGPLKLPKESAE